MKKPLQAMIFDIKRDSSEDGPGIRTTVFFKGCPLSCSWCQNPESKNASLDISFVRSRCHPSVCYAPCIASCPNHSIRLDNGIQINRHKCKRCNKCLSVCEFKALEPVGYRIGINELLNRILLDHPFFVHSGGGVTLSGGEPTAQIKFVSHLLHELKQRNIHTAIETCGYFEYNSFVEKLLPYLDLIYYDLKLFEEAESKQYTGKSNLIIKDNLRRLTREKHVELIPRIPLIPFITATINNLRSWSEYLKNLGVNKCELLPFNPTYKDKLTKLGIDNRYENTHFMSLQEQQTCVNQFFQ